MTRRLWLLRHAKSSWDDPDLADHDRPLNNRGWRAAVHLAEHIARSELEPDLVLCSTSRRTRETLGVLLPEWRGPQTVRLHPALYGADAGEILYLLHGIDESVTSTMVIGHNPGLGELALRLAGLDRSAPALRLAQKFPTGALATFDVEAAWESLVPESVSLVDFVVPRDLTAG